MNHAKPRVRVCGLLEKKGQILLLKHEKMGRLGYIWSPPGGGLDFHESVEHGLIREFYEETHLQIEIDRFLFVNEYIDEKFHAIELFFKVLYKKGEVKLGFDPEFSTADQILSDLKFFSESELNSIPSGKKHNIFDECTSFERLFNMKGFYNFRNI